MSWSNLLKPLASAQGAVESGAAMAAPKQTTPGISLSAIMESQQTQTELEERRRAMEQANLEQEIDLTAIADQKSAAILESSEANNSEMWQTQRQLLSQQDEIIARGQRAMELANSDNPLDRMQLWLLQQSSNTYTREGNQARLNYIQESARASGLDNLITQQENTQEMGTVQRDLALALQPGKNALAMIQLAEKQGNERMDGAVANLAIQADIISKTSAIQEGAVSSMTLEDVSAAEQAAAASDTGTVNVQGVDVPVQKLTERRQSLMDRQWLETVRANESQSMVLQNMTLPDVIALESQAVADGGVTKKNGVPMSLAMIQDRKRQFTDIEYAQKLQAEGLAGINQRHQLETDNKILGTMNETELQNLKANGGYDNNGHQYDIAAVDTYLNSMGQANLTAAQRQMAGAQMAEPLTAAIDAKSFLDSINAPPGSPLAAVVQQQRQVVSVAAGMLGATEFTSQVVGQEALQGSYETVNAAIASEAKRLGAGDKNLELAYSYSLRGQIMPAGDVKAAIVENQIAGKSNAQWLTPQNATIYNNAFWDAKGVLDDPSNLTGAKYSEKEKREIAAAQAFDAIQGNLSVGLTDRIMMSQVMEVSHPLYNRVSENDMAVMIKAADAQGIQMFQQQNNLSDEDLAAAIQQGDSRIATTQMAALYMSLEAKQVGYGDKYIDWWTKGRYSEAYVTKVTQATAAEKATGDMASAAEFAIVQPQVNPLMQSYRFYGTDGRNQALTESINDQHGNYIMFGGDPATKQAFLLQQDPNLTSTDKQLVMSNIIEPLIQQGQSQQITDPAQMTLFIETKLNTFTSEDPETRKVLGKMKAGRDATLTIMDNFAQLNWGKATDVNRMGWTEPSKAGAITPMTTQVQGFDWWTKK